MSILPGAITKVCYVTHDLERAIARWAEGIKAGPFYVMSHAADSRGRTYRGGPARDSLIAGMGFCGNTLIEFIQPTNDEPSVFQEVLKEKGDMAIHHIYPNMCPLREDEYETIRDHYLSLGYAVVNDVIMPSGGHVLQLDAREKIGLFVELVQCPPEVFANLEYMRAAHFNWNGQRPRRDFMESITH